MHVHHLAGGACLLYKALHKINNNGGAIKIFKKSNSTKFLKNLVEFQNIEKTRWTSNGNTTASSTIE